jgi:hypothetical protein
MSGSFAREYTRFTNDQLRIILTHLHIPEEFRIHERRCQLTGEEVFLISLVYIASGELIYRMLPTHFGMYNPREFGYAFRIFIQYLYNTFYHKITGNCIHMQWIDKIAIWKKLISSVTRRERRVDGQLHGIEYIFTWIPFLNFRIFGFNDDIAIETCRPTNLQLEDAVHDIQRAFYSRYYRHHGVKFQVVLFPNGMIGSVFRSSLRTNDRGILNLSGLNDY